MCLTLKHLIQISKNCAVDNLIWLIIYSQTKFNRPNQKLDEIKKGKSLTKTYKML